MEVGKYRVSDGDLRSSVKLLIISADGVYTPRGGMSVSFAGSSDRKNLQATGITRAAAKSYTSSYRG